MSKKLKLFAGLLVLSSPLMAFFLTPEFAKHKQGKDANEVTPNNHAFLSQTTGDNTNVSALQRTTLSTNPVKNSSIYANKNQVKNGHTVLKDIDISEQSLTTDKPQTVEKNKAPPKTNFSTAAITKIKSPHSNKDVSQSKNVKTNAEHQFVSATSESGYNESKGRQQLVEGIDSAAMHKSINAVLKDIKTDNLSPTFDSQDRNSAHYRKDDEQYALNNRSGTVIVDATPVYLKDDDYTTFVNSKTLTSILPNTTVVKVSKGDKVFDRSDRAAPTVLTSEVAKKERVVVQKVKKMSTPIPYTLSYADATQKQGDTDYSTLHIPVLIDETQPEDVSGELNKILADEIRAAAEVWEINGSTDSTAEYVKNRANANIKQYAISSVTDPVTSWLNQYGTARLSLNLDDKFHSAGYAFDYFLPLWQSKFSLFFSQMGAREWQDRSLVDFGIGYRYFSSQWMFGSNLFYDSDQTFGHSRASIGLEAAANFLRWTSNYYMPVSDWKSQDVSNIAFNVEARAATGYDTTLTTFFPAYPQLSTSVEYFRWINDVVDQNGAFHQDATIDGWKQMMDTAKGYNVSLDWRPVPLFSTTINQTLSKQVSDTSLMLNVTYNFDQSLQQQLKQESVYEESLMSSMKHIMVERNYNMVLAYRSDVKNPAKIKIILPQTVGDVLPNSIIPLTVNVKTPLPIASYQWQGSGVPYLYNNKKLIVNGQLNPIFKAPAFNRKGSNRYELYLQVRDINNTTTQSDSIFFNVVETLPRTVTTTFYKDADKKQLVDIKNSAYESRYTAGGIPSESVKIFWQYQLTSSDNKEALQNCSQDEQCQASWSDPDNILVDDLAVEPTIKSAFEMGAGDYKVTLNAKIKGSHNITQEVPILVLAAEKSDIAFKQVKDGGTWSRPFQQDFVVNDNSAQSVLYPTEKNIQYTVENNDGVISAINQTNGSFTLLTPGSVIIKAKHTSENNRYFKPTEVSYTLNVEDLSRNIIWSDDAANNEKIVEKVYSTNQQYTISATGPKGTQIEYYIKPQAIQTVASVFPYTGQVTLKTAGETQICAKASYGLLSFSGEAIHDCYSLLVEPGQLNNNFHWSQVKPDASNEVIDEVLKTIDSSAVIEPAPSDGNFAINYDSINKNVASFKDDGKIILNKMGKSTITATLVDNANRYTAAPISYKLVVDYAPRPSQPKWKDPSGRIKNGTITMTYGDNNNIIDDVTLTGEIGDGSISYWPENVSTNGGLTVNPSTGRVKIKNFQPNFVVKAQQKAGSVYDASSVLQYILTVTSQVNEGLTWEDGKLDNEIRCALKNAKSFTLKAKSCDKKHNDNMHYRVLNLSTSVESGKLYTDTSKVTWEDDTVFTSTPIIVEVTQDEYAGVEATTAQYQLAVKDSCSIQR